MILPFSLVVALFGCLTGVWGQPPFYGSPGPDFYNPGPVGFYDFGGYRPDPYGNPGFSPAYPPPYGLYNPPRYQPPPPPPPPPQRPAYSPRPPRRHRPSHRPHLSGSRSVADHYVDRLSHKDDSKILSRSIGQRVPGGIAAPGKYPTLYSCERACARFATCFAADYDAHSKKCFFHGSSTACDRAESAHGVTHFKKITCTAPGATANSQVSPGMFRAGGILIPGVKSLTDCVKTCEKTGGGLGVACFGIDWDMSAKKCYIHTVVADSCIAPTTLQPREDVTHINYCP